MVPGAELVLGLVGLHKSAITYRIGIALLL